MMHEDKSFKQEIASINQLDERIDKSCARSNLKREKISNRNGQIEIVSQLDIEIPTTLLESLLESRRELVGNQDTFFSCMQIAAGACLRGLTDGVLTTYESKKTQQLVGSSNHALAWKELSGACVAIDFTAKDLFKTNEKPDVFLIIAKNAEELKRILNEIYGDDGTNDLDSTGWEEQSPYQIQKNQEIYLQRFVKPLERIIVKLKQKIKNR